MKAPLFLLLVLSPVAFADTMPPALVWSNSVTVIHSDCNNCESNSLQIDDTGPLIIEDDGRTAGGGEGFDYTVDTNFNVVTAGDFQISGLVYYAGGSSMCGDRGCLASLFSGEFSEGIQILDGSTVVFSQPFNGSESAVAGCDQCEADLGFFGSLSDLVNLPVGDYTLQVFYQDSEDSYGDGYGHGISSTNIVPAAAVPEPHSLWLVLLGLTTMVRLQAHRKTNYQRKLIAAKLTTLCSSMFHCW
jgi:hypothetical protein